MVSATPSYRSVRRAVFTLPFPSKLRTAPEFRCAKHAGRDISRPIPKHNRRSYKTGASSGRGVPPKKDLNGDSTNHILILRDTKGDAQCHTLQSERKIQATSSFTTKTMPRANQSCY